MLEARGSAAQPLVSLLTDFGLVDPFVAEMKAVILSICPQVRILDVSHGVAAFDIAMGAFLLAEAAPSFPPATVHVAVVDPGVGGARRPIVVETKRSAYVGPDNGLLILAATMEGIVRVIQITNQSMIGREVSLTFHGRDIFAPIAARIACGHRPEECGPSISDYLPSPLHDPVIEGRQVTCEILHVDRFGNLATNLTPAHLKLSHMRIGQEITLSLGRRRIHARVVKTFSDLRGNEVGLIVGSHRFLEIACRESNAAKRLKIRRGNVVHVSD